MTLHEIVTSLFWIVAMAYVAYVGWFVREAIRDRGRSPRTSDRRTR